MNKIARTTLALTVAAGIVMTGASAASAAAPTVARKVVIADSKIKVGVTEKERSLVNEKERGFVDSSVARKAEKER